MHIDRLRQIKPTIQITAPKKPQHMKQNYKKELQNLERMSEIQYQNRILLRKMLQIDLKPSGHVSANPREQPESNPSGLNAYNSLNRANRIKEIAQIANDNRQFLGRLQGTNSQYSASAWENEYKQNTKISSSIASNSDRYCKNPYFLHSVCTHEVGQPGYAISNRAKSTKKSRRGSTTRKIMSSQGTRGDVNSHLRPFSAPKGINQEGRRIKIRTASGARRARQKQ